MRKPAIDIGASRSDGSGGLAGGKASNDRLDVSRCCARTGPGQSLAQRRQPSRWNDYIGKARKNRIRSVHGLPGQSKIAADLARDAREQPGAADIWEESESDFRHRQFRFLGDDAMAGMSRQPDAAAHHKT